MRFSDYKSNLIIRTIHVHLVLPCVHGQSDTPLRNHERLYGAEIETRINGQQGDVLFDGDGDVDDDGCDKFVQSLQVRRVTCVLLLLTNERDDSLDDGERDCPVERLLVVDVPDSALAMKVVQVENGGRGDARQEGPDAWENNQEGFHRKVFGYLSKNCICDEVMALVHRANSRKSLPAWRLANVATNMMPPRKPATTPKAANEMCAQRGNRKQPAMPK